MDQAIERATENGGSPRARARRRRHAHRRPARPRGRRALRPRPRRPRRLPRRPRRRQARHARRGHAATRPCPVSFAGDRTLLVAMVDPANVLAIDDIAVMTGYEVRPAVASLADIERAARAPRGPQLRQRRHRAARSDGRRRRGRSRRRSAGRRPPRPLYDLRENAPINFGVGGEDASVIQLVHRVIKEAVERGASDIHFEPGEEEMRVRYRIDGVLQEAATVPGQRHPRRHLAHQDPLRPRHRRAPDPAGRPHLARGRRTSRSTSASRRCPSRLRREGRHANPRPEQGHDRARAARHAAAGARALHQGVRARRTAPCSSPARPAPASRPRSTARSTSSTRSRRTSSRSRTRSSTSSTASRRSRSTTRRA